MIRRTIIMIITIISIITILTGCTYNTKSNNKLNDEIVALKEENKNLIKENEELKQAYNDNNKDKKSEVVSLPVYTINEDNYQLIEVEDYIQVYTNTSMEEKLNSIAQYLSKSHFTNLPIEIVKIEDNIAYINLKEDSNNKYNWSNYYFQGSYGGMKTATKLIETFLQRNYKGEWIKGVRFMYNDQIDWEFEHLGDDFSKVHYR